LMLTGLKASSKVVEVGSVNSDNSEKRLNGPGEPLTSKKGEVRMLSGGCFGCCTTLAERLWFCQWLGAERKLENVCR
jgi:hypothetical protein